MSASDICNVLREQMKTLSFDGLTGIGMTWDEDGAVSKDPKAVVIKEGSYSLIQ